MMPILALILDNSSYAASFVTSSSCWHRANSSFCRSFSPNFYDSIFSIRYFSPTDFYSELRMLSIFRRRAYS